MRVLILGCGYVGLPLAAELARRGQVVFGVRRTQAADAELRAAGVAPWVADVTEPTSLARLPDPFDWVVNCVSAAGGGAADHRRVYLDGMRHVLEWLAASPPRRFVYTSSTGVYGQQDGAAVTETSATTPGTPTGDMLVESERLLLRAGRDHGFSAVILRVAGIYGPGRGYWLKQFLAGEARMEGEGERVLNMIHRDDVVGAILAALERGRPGEIYNAVDDAPVTQQELFAWLASTLDKPLPPSVPPEAGGARRRGLTSKRVSNRKLRDELGWRPRYPSFREGFAAELARLGPPPA
jgi:nucleoside-diphosphate-sugar epimerase